MNKLSQENWTNILCFLLRIHGAEGRCKDQSNKDKEIGNSNESDRLNDNVIALNENVNEFVIFKKETDADE